MPSGVFSAVYKVCRFLCFANPRGGFRRIVFEFVKPVIDPHHAYGYIGLYLSVFLSRFSKIFVKRAASIAAVYNGKPVSAFFIEDLLRGPDIFRLWWIAYDITV
jgi:hypothetical protein